MVRIETLLKIVTYLCALAGFASARPHLGAVYTAGTAVLCLLALPRDSGKLKLPIPRWFLNLASVAVLAPSVLRISMENIVGPVLEGLVLLLGIKLLEDKKTRDYMQIFLICMFLLIGSTLISLNISFLFYFIPLILLSTAGLILLAFFSHDPDISIPGRVVPKVLSQSLFVCAVSIPACALMFVILPRTDFPFFSLFGRVEAAKSGFSDTVSLGDITVIQEDPTVVLRAEMPMIDEKDLYWRGVELDRFDGVSWRRGSERHAEPWENLPKNGGTAQTIYLEPSGARYLFALDRPVSIYAEGARHRKDPRSHLWHENILQRIRYRAVSVASDSAPGGDLELDRYLALPAGFSPRISELAAKIAGQGGDPVANLVKLLRSGQYEYSIDGLHKSDSPLEDFLFEYRRGNCEYFASALGAMLRSVGIPARLVAGYRGGYYNRAGKYYLVLQKNAHVWVEAYRAGRWLRIDPTPVNALTPEEAYRESIFLRVRLLFDTFDYYWGKFVIGYDLARQIALFDKVKTAITRPDLDIIRMRDLSVLLAPYAAIAAAIAALVALMLRRIACRPEQMLISRFFCKMRKRGYIRSRGEGLEEFSSRISEPELKIRATEFVSEFQDIYYRDRKLGAYETKRLKSLIRCL